jgi:voltage-gated potassium channel Kch
MQQTSKRTPPTTAQFLRYHADRLMAAGAIAQLGVLALLTLVPVVITGIVLAATKIVPEGTKDPFDLSEGLWLGLMYALDAGNLGGAQGWSYRIVMAGVTVVGLLLMSLLIGVLSNGIDARLQELRKGRSYVVEKGHTLILGWSPNIFSVISELVIANENVAKPRIVIMADKDKVEMEDEIRAKIPKPGRTRIVCRSGSPIDVVDLDMVNPHDAKSIIVLSQPGDDPDVDVIKTVLAITNNPGRGPEPFHIVAEIRDEKNMEVAELVGKDETQIILTSDLISRITVQTCRQSGMSVVYTELLDFEGNEIYIRKEPSLAGHAFADCLTAYANAVVMGIHHADGTVALNPPMDTKLGATDALILIGEDDASIARSTSVPKVDEAVLRQRANRPAGPERTLILGWNGRGDMIIRELAAYVADGSSVHVVAMEGMGDPEIPGMSRPNQVVTFEEADTTTRATLSRLDVPAYDHVIVLSYSDQLDVQAADARTLMTLLHLREIVKAAGKEIAIVSEMMDVRNRDLALVTQVNDFIVSEKLASLMLSQVSENKALKAVFADLLDPEGSELYLKPVGDYVALDTPVDFHALTEAAKRRGEVALGYRRQAEAASAQLAFGVVVNPNKDRKVAFSTEDRVIVLAEDGST